MSRQGYFEHDNRSSNSSIYRPPGAMGRQKKFSLPRPRGKSRLVMNDDVDMSAPNSGPEQRRYNPYAPKNHNNRKKHRKQNAIKSKHNHGGPQESELMSWFRITVPYGKKTGKEFILKSISSLIRAPFIPFNFHFTGNAAEFFVDDHAAARQIRDVNRRVTTPDGFKMSIQMHRCPAPAASIDPESAELLKNCMSARYEAMSHNLNLTKFHADQAMKNLGLYMPLNKPSVLSNVSKVIKEHIPEIEVLNLTENRLYSLEALSSLVSVCKQLRTIILSTNKLRSVAELNHLKGLEVQNLILDGNPLCDDYKDKASYISAVRDRFPKLLNLDGHELPPPIGFDLGPETFPASRKSFFAEEVKDLVIAFLDQYYTIYDSGDRSKLLDAYHDQANFSLSLSISTHKGGSGTLAAYNLDNRNLLRITDFSQRFKLLKQGKLSIVSALSDLPQTMHDPTSFSVDIFHVSPGLMCFSVVGVFKEVGADINNATVKTFNRTYVVAAQGQGFVITNETLFIAHASQDQQAKAFKVPAPTPSPSPAPSNEEKSVAEKQMLVIELTKQTGMNLDFSTRCLEENDWDYQRSFAVFMKFQSEGKLPREAFAAV